MKKLLTIFAFIFLLSGVALAQDYATGIGLRGGFSNGFTVKHFMDDDTAVEGILTTRWKGFMVTGLYEIHNYPFAVQGLSWYYGVGGHIGFWDGHDADWADDDDSYTVIGVDGVLGLEYNFVEVPINLSLDWKPALNLIGYSGFWGDGGALSIRYIF